MDVVFVAYPMETFKVYKDTSYVMMRQAQRRGHAVWLTTPRDVFWQSGQTVQATATRLHLLETPTATTWGPSGTRRGATLAWLWCGAHACRPAL